MVELHWTMGCKGDGVGKAVAFHFKLLPWRYQLHLPVWIVTGFDCDGRCFGTFKRNYPARGVKVVFKTADYIDSSGHFLAYASDPIMSSFMIDPTMLSLEDTPASALPSDFILDVRTLEQLKEECCPPQMAVMFEGIEMI